MLDEHARTIDMLRDHPEWEEAVFLLGADEFADFLDWKEPDEVLAPRAARRRDAAGLPARAPRRGARHGSTRPSGCSSSSSSRSPIASSELRARLDRGEDVHELVPAAVWELIERDGLYGPRLH